MNIAIVNKETNIVETVLVATDINFLKNLVKDTYPDVSYLFKEANTGVGCEWHYNISAFVAPKPYPSWVLNTEIKQYEAPVEKHEGLYYWNEDKLNWIEIKL